MLTPKSVTENISADYWKAKKIIEWLPYSDKHTIEDRRDNYIKMRLGSQVAIRNKGVKNADARELPLDVEFDFRRSTITVTDAVDIRTNAEEQRRIEGNLYNVIQMIKSGVQIQGFGSVDQLGG